MSARVERLMRELAAAMREEIGALPDNILTLGEEVKAARAYSRMSLQEVADAAGFTKSHVWEVEAGRARNPTVGLISGLSKALGVPFLRLAQAALNTAETPPPADAAAQPRTEPDPSPSPGRSSTPLTQGEKP
jgi:transcriptional regulator with XRE-family HTH domain